MINLIAGDIIVFKVMTDSFLGKLESLLTEWGHVAMYYGDGDIIESVGRGVVRCNLKKNYDRRSICVMRLKVNAEILGKAAAFEALRICHDQKSFYDYRAIIDYAIPRLILKRLNLPAPKTWKQNNHYICSELVYEAYEDANVFLGCVEAGDIPLPEDFLKSPMLKNMYTGPLIT